VIRTTTFPITFGRHTGPAHYLQTVERLALSFNLTRVRQHTQTLRPPSTGPVLRRFAKQLLPASYYADVRAANRLALTPAARRWLRRPVPQTLYEYRTPDRALSLTLELAGGNHIPAMGAELWLRKRIPVFGGFVTIRAADSALLKSASSTLRKRLGVGKPIWRSPSASPAPPPGE
jgi:hypothetical protein